MFCSHLIGWQPISISRPDDSSKLMGVATFALVVSFGTAAAPGAATYSGGETTIWEIREGSKTLQSLQLLVFLW